MCLKEYQKCYNDLFKPLGEFYIITDNIKSISSLCNNENKILSNYAHKEIPSFSLLFGIISIYYKENSKYNDDKPIISNKIVKLK